MKYLICPNISHIFCLCLSFQTPKSRRGESVWEAPPAMAALVKRVYVSLVGTRRDHSVCAVGRSGTGKTTACQTFTHALLKQAGTSGENVSGERSRKKKKTREDICPNTAKFHFFFSPTCDSTLQWSVCRPCSRSSGRLVVSAPSTVTLHLASPWSSRWTLTTLDRPQLDTCRHVDHTCKITS